MPIKPAVMSPGRRRNGVMMMAVVRDRRHRPVVVMANPRQRGRSAQDQGRHGERHEQRVPDVFDHGLVRPLT
jgi:hypothetical protein